MAPSDERLDAAQATRRELEHRLASDIETAWYTSVHDVTDAARGADVLVIGFIDAAEIRTAIEAATSARWISTHAAGVDHYPMDLLSQMQQLLTKGAGVNAPPIAEFAVLCVLSAAKSFPYFLSSSDRHAWPERRPPAQRGGG